MRTLVALLGALLFIVGLAQAADIELDMDLMQTIEDTNKSLSSNIALENISASVQDAQELHALFKTVEAHYEAKPDAPDGLELSRKSLELTNKIVEQVNAKAFGAASESATQLSRTCRACHTFYKQS